MNDVIEFIITNWKVLLIVLVTILTFIFQLIFKKNPVVKDDSATFTICQLVEKAESIFGAGNGDKKLQYVLDCLKDTDGIYKPIIEWILSLPKKKR